MIVCTCDVPKIDPAKSMLICASCGGAIPSPSPFNVKVSAIELLRLDPHAYKREYENQFPRSPDRVVYVIARSFKMAKAWQREVNENKDLFVFVPNRLVVYVFSADRLRGVPIGYYVFYEDWYYHRDAQEISEGVNYLRQAGRLTPFEDFLEEKDKEK